MSNSLVCSFFPKKFRHGVSQVHKNSKNDTFSVDIGAGKNSDDKIGPRAFPIFRRLHSSLHSSLHTFRSSSDLQVLVFRPKMRAPEVVLLLSEASVPVNFTVRLFV